MVEQSKPFVLKKVWLTLLQGLFFYASFCDLARGDLVP
jgi:hypothetical protein